MCVARFYRNISEDLTISCVNQCQEIDDPDSLVSCFHPRVPEPNGAYEGLVIVHMPDPRDDTYTIPDLYVSVGRLRSLKSFDPHPNADDLSQDSPDLDLVSKRSQIALASVAYFQALLLHAVPVSSSLTLRYPVPIHTAEWPIIDPTPWLDWATARDDDARNLKHPWYSSHHPRGRQYEMQRILTHLTHENTPWAGYYVYESLMGGVDPPMYFELHVSQWGADGRPNADVVWFEGSGGDGIGLFTLKGGVHSRTGLVKARKAYATYGFNWKGVVTPFGMIGNWGGPHGGVWWVWPRGWSEDRSGDAPAS